MDLRTRSGRIEPSTRAYILQTETNINYIHWLLNKPRNEQTDNICNELLPQYQRQLAALMAMEENELLSQLAGGLCS